MASDKNNFIEFKNLIIVYSEKSILVLNSSPNKKLTVQKILSPGALQYEFS
jgi:hypothetical protein